MHILGAILAILGVAGVWYWRFKTLHQAGTEIADVVGRAQGAIRTRRFRNKAEGSVLTTVDDPAVAAAVFLYALAGENRDAAHLSDTAIRKQIGAIVPSGDLDEVATYAAWAARSVIDPKDCIRRFKTLWRDKLTLGEREDLVAMAEAIAALGGKPLPAQALTLETLRATVLS